MARYHFEIIDGYKLEDPVGLECRSDDEARKVAEQIARQIVIDVGKGRRARKVVVVDDDGVEICMAPIKT
jgi:regulator of extracellular matrix RemA (YlzA/DUF370 family)